VKGNGCKRDLLVENTNWLASRYCKNPAFTYINKLSNPFLSCLDDNSACDQGVKCQQPATLATGACMQA